MLGVGDGLMPGPHPLMISDHRAVTVHADPVQIGDHFDAAPDHPGMHRVVIGVQPDVMIARHPVTGGTDGTVSIACRSAPIRSVGAHPSTRRVRPFTTASHCCIWWLKSPGPLNVRPGRNDRSK